MTGYPVTVEEAMKFADKCRADGYPELGAIFDSISEKIAWFNEYNPYTVEELRQRVGDEMFEKILSGKVWSS